MVTYISPRISLQSVTCRAGWALTLLSEENLSYASTCQTIGLNTGYFASFTVFMALNSEAFRYAYAMTIYHLAL